MKTRSFSRFRQILTLFLLGYLLVLISNCRTAPKTSSSISGLYNLRKDLLEPADTYYRPEIQAADLPTAVNLKERGQFPPVFDQGPINSCSANVVAAAVYYDMIKQAWRTPFVPSRMFIYYNERKLAGTLDSLTYGDIGAPVTLRTCIRSIHEQGYCDERFWPYDTQKLYTQPSNLAYDSAQHHHTYRYERIHDSLEDLKSCLAEGLPFLCGIPVYPAFESASVKQSGQVPMPTEAEQNIGGHAILVVGYDDQNKLFTFRNSFGKNWGNAGYGTLPFEYLTQHGFDFWVIEKTL